MCFILYDESVWWLLWNVFVKLLEFLVGNLFGFVWFWVLLIFKFVFIVFWVVKNEEDVFERLILGFVFMVIIGVLLWICYLDVFNI